MNSLGDYDRWKLASPYDDEPEDDSDYWDDDDNDDLVVICDTPGCLFCGEHYRSECFTVEDCERQHEDAFWSEHPEIATLLRHSQCSQDMEINRMRDHVLHSIRATVAAARVACGLPAASCEQCHETLHTGFCADFAILSARS